MDKVTSLEFDAEPDYKGLSFILETAILRKGGTADDKYDWNSTIDEKQ